MDNREAVTVRSVHARDLGPEPGTPVVTFRGAWHWAFGKHPPRPPNPDRTVEAAWLPHWQARMITDLLVDEGIPAVMTEDFEIHLTMYSREPMARIFVTEDRKAEAQELIQEITGVPPAERKL